VARQYLRTAAGYYKWKPGLQLSEVLDRWASQGQKIYDNSMPAFYTPRDLWPLREYTWTRDTARSGHAWVQGKLVELPGPLKWDAMKVDLKARGWDPKDPAHVDVGKDGNIKVGEGNHRLALAREIGLSKIPVTIHFVPNARKMPQPSREPVVTLPPKAVEKAIEAPSEPMSPETEALVDELMSFF
jgi:hypothetical protein